MAKIIGSPGRYIQGPGEIGNVGAHVSKIGAKALVVVSPSGKGRVGDALGKSLADNGIAYDFAEFGGECSKPEIDRIGAIAKDVGADVIIGAGGGKLIDVSKATAYYGKIPVVIVPTIAATDAPCSALSVIYTPDGVFVEYLFLPQNPNMVIVDSSIVAKAPVRLLVSGMGDALATYFEAKSAIFKEADNCVGGKGTLAALAIAKLCYETLMSQGVKAKLAVAAGGRTSAVEKIIEANTLLSGLGFESGGLAGAHAVHNGLTAYEETHSFYHGEKVAFGTLVQLVLEDYPMDEIKEVVDFCNAVGLPITLSGLGITNPDNDKLFEVAKLACADGDTMGNLMVSVTPEEVYAGILAADAIGKALS
ncbi:MAG: glycerol dehydrogenase [Clostridiales Family XIII bacterium]|jgi:glycerol dehydrogenase|nr:glycerol dehydrogenase [Clostridiales Family XIII bacterium]